MQEVLERGSSTDSEHDRLRRLRVFVRVLVLVTALTAVVAVLANWLVLRSRSEQFAVRPVEKPITTYQPGLDFALEKSALDLLPGQVIAYETVARHPVPGRGEQAAEALYVTLNMDVEIQVPIALYARAEAFASSAEAQSALQERMSPYSLRPERMQFGSKIAQTGYSDDEGTWAVGWSEGQYYTFVKSQFKDKIPVEKRDFLRNLGRPLVAGIEKYQRTGEQGLQF